MSANPNWIGRSGACDTPAMFRDADFDDPKNVWMFTKMEEYATTFFGHPMYMVRRDGTHFSFSSCEADRESEPDFLAVVLAADVTKAKIAAEAKDKGITKVTCWNCGRCFCNKISVCGRCSTARYCSDVCQRRHWPQHAKKCRVWKHQRLKRKMKK
jgi:hypothetical protein